MGNLVSDHRNTLGQLLRLGC